VATYAEVGEMLVNAMRAKAMAESACSPNNKRVLAGMAADYEWLARCKLTIMDTQRCLADSRRLLDM
jgi:hypothetical protein